MYCLLYEFSQTDASQIDGYILLITKERIKIVALTLHDRLNCAAGKQDFSPQSLLFVPITQIASNRAVAI